VPDPPKANERGESEMMDYKNHLDRIRTACRRLHHTYAINWTTAILTMGLALFAQLFGIAARYEYQRGALSAGGLQHLLGQLVVAQAFIVGFWLLLGILAWLGPRPRDVAVRP